MTHDQIVVALDQILASIPGGSWVALSRMLEALADIAERSPNDPPIKYTADTIDQLLIVIESLGSFKVIDYLDRHPDPLPNAGAIEYVISGAQVQGVGFRAYVQHEANDRSLHGWIRNEPDATVRAMLYPRDPSDVRVFETIVLSAPNATIGAIHSEVRS